MKHLWIVALFPVCLTAQAIPRSPVRLDTMRLTFAGPVGVRDTVISLRNFRAEMETLRDAAERVIQNQQRHLAFDHAVLDSLTRRIAKLERECKPLVRVDSRQWKMMPDLMH